MTRIKHLCLAAIVLLVPCFRAADREVSTDKSPSGTIAVEPADGELASFHDKHTEGRRSIRVTFPTTMVPIEKVKRGGQPCPIVFEPVVELRWIWLSQTEGEITFPFYFEDEQNWSARMGKVLHHAKLRPDLKDLSGNPVNPRNWGAEFKYDKFTLRSVEFLSDAFVGDLGEGLYAEKAGSDPAAEISRRLQRIANPQPSPTEEEEWIAYRELSWSLLARPRVRPKIRLLPRHRDRKAISGRSKP